MSGEITSKDQYLISLSSPEAMVEPCRFNYIHNRVRDLKVGREVPAGFCALRGGEWGGVRRRESKHLEDLNFNFMRNGGEV